MSKSLQAVDQMVPGANLAVSYTHLRAHETNESISYAVFCL